MIVENLKRYGYDLTLNESMKILKVSYNDKKIFCPYHMYRNNGQDKNKDKLKIYEKDITVEINGCKLTTNNVDGKLLISPYQLYNNMR